jgi:hypothetical protein
VIHPLQTGVYATWLSGRKKFFRKKISKEGTAIFDTTPTFPSLALFLDASHALILKKGPAGAYIRVGRATFFDQVGEVDKKDVPDGALREIVIV